MTSYHDEHLSVYQGDWIEVLRTLPSESVHCVVTSPPYWGLRDFGTATWVGGDGDCDHVPVDTERTAWANSVPGPAGATAKNAKGRNETKERGGRCSKCGATRVDAQLGLEPTPDAYVAAIVAGFREVRRVLRKDGTLWLNLGDSYATGAGQVGERPGGGAQGDAWNGHRGSRGGSSKQPHTGNAIGPMTQPNRMPQPGLKPKDRVMIPARVALALQADGWWLRDEIVWHKPNPMPSSVQDRTTSAHEMVYLLTKSARYWYDGAAIAEPSVGTNHHDMTGAGTAAPGQTPQRGNRQKVPGGWDIEPGTHATIHRNGRTPATYREATLPGNVSASTERQRVGLNGRWDASVDDGTAPLTRNKRSVWTVATQPYPKAHFATFPEALITPMILAGCPSDGTVLDPFAGSGTTGLVANRLGRRAILIDLSTEYLDQALTRNQQKPLGLLA